MISSKLTSTGRTTIPQAVRAALRLREGDKLRYEIGDHKVILSKAPPEAPVDDPFSVFEEWAEADEKAYASL